jgi:hypothetical protein
MRSRSGCLLLLWNRGPGGVFVLRHRRYLELSIPDSGAGQHQHRGPWILWPLIKPLVNYKPQGAGGWRPSCALLLPRPAGPGAGAGAPGRKWESGERPARHLPVTLVYMQSSSCFLLLGTWDCFGHACGLW